MLNLGVTALVGTKAAAGAADLGLGSEAEEVFGRTAGAAAFGAVVAGSALLGVRLGIVWCLRIVQRLEVCKLGDLGTVNLGLTAEVAAVSVEGGV